MFGRETKKRIGGEGKGTTVDGNEISLTLYKFDSCFFCRRVFQVIDDLEIPVRYRDIRSEAGAREELAEKGGSTQVPCLFVDSKPIYESQDIIRYLEDTFAQGSTADV